MSRETKQLSEIANAVPLLASEIGTKKINDFLCKMGGQCEKSMDMLSDFTEEIIAKVEKNKKANDRGDVWNEKLEMEMQSFYMGIIEKFCGFMFSMMSEEEMIKVVAESAANWALNDIKSDAKDPNEEEE